MALYDLKPSRWTDLPWRNLYNPRGPTYRITTRPFDGLAGPPDEVRVRKYREVLAGYRVHHEDKFLGPHGRPCRKDTVGLLQRRPVKARSVTHIGKEANRLEDVQQGLVADLGEATGRASRHDQRTWRTGGQGRECEFDTRHCSLSSAQNSDQIGRALQL